MSSVQQQKLIGVEELAEWLGVATSTIYGWQLKGGGPTALKIGRLLKFRPADVEKWLRQQEVDVRAVR